MEALEPVESALGAYIAEPRLTNRLLAACVLWIGVVTSCCCCCVLLASRAGARCPHAASHSPARGA